MGYECPSKTSMVHVCSVGKQWNTSVDVSGDFLHHLEHVGTSATEHKRGQLHFDVKIPVRTSHAFSYKLGYISQEY